MQMYHSSVESPNLISWKVLIISLVLFITAQVGQFFWPKTYCILMPPFKCSENLHKLIKCVNIDSQFFIEFFLFSIFIQNILGQHFCSRQTCKAVIFAAFGVCRCMIKKQEIREASKETTIYSCYYLSAQNIF